MGWFESWMSEKTSLTQHNMIGDNTRQSWMIGDNKVMDDRVVQYRMVGIAERKSRPLTRMSTMLLACLGLYPQVSENQMSCKTSKSFYVHK